MRDNVKTKHEPAPCGGRTEVYRDPDPVLTNPLTAVHPSPVETVSSWLPEASISFASRASV